MVGEYRDPTLLTGFTVAQGAFDKLVPATQGDPIYIIASTSADPAQAKAAVAAALKTFPTATVQTKTEYTASLKKQVDQLLTLIYALLAVSVIISVFGIVNTLVLSVYERTREIGMLRAIGTTRRQMRRIVRYESVITSIIGGILGTVLGVVQANVPGTDAAPPVSVEDANVWPTAIVLAVGSVDTVGVAWFTTMVTCAWLAA